MSPIAGPSASDLGKLGDLAAESGLHRVSMLAWRDLDDPEAGGSEVHASTVAQYWAEAGLEVTMRTSFAAGKPQMSWRDGYRVIRKAGRYMVFPRAAFSEMMGWHGGRDGLVEIWNGMPFFSPLWSRTPHITFLHHIHGVMWDMTLPPRLARAGRFVESRLAPPVYHWTPVVTLSESSKHELVNELHFKSSRVTVVPPGIDPKFSPAGEPAAQPLVVAVGRLVPVKRFDLLIDALVDAKQQVPELRAVIIGEGYERESLEARLREASADEWISLPGHVTDEELIDLYRSAWVIASASAREGWGMTLTEAAACGTPAVATRIAGHLDAVVDGRTGLLTGERREDLAGALAQVLRDHDLRRRLSTGAGEYASRYTWGATALGTLQVLAREAMRLRGHR